MSRARLTRRAAALATATVLALSALGPASYADLTTASPAPPYLNGLGTKFYASANKAWTNARELTPDASSNPLSKPPGEWDPDTIVWTKSCSKKAQTGTFQRTLDLPGPPTAASLLLGAWAPVVNGFKSYSLKVNGTTVAKGVPANARYTSPTSVVFSAQALTAFRDGPNTVVVTLKRNALPKGQKKCNTSDADRYGAFFRLSGDFGADLALFDGPVRSYIYRKAGTTNTAITNITLRNDGPSAAVAGGTFWVKVSGVKSVVMLGDSTTPIPGTYPAAPPFEDCVAVTTYPAPNLVVEITCELGAMPVGMTGYLSIGTVQEFTSTQFTESSTNIQWKVGHPVDSTYDNQRAAEYVWCGTSSTKPECINAS